MHMMKLHFDMLRPMTSLPGKFSSRGHTETCLCFARSHRCENNSLSASYLSRREIRFVEHAHNGKRRVAAPDTKLRKSLRNAAVGSHCLCSQKKIVISFMHFYENDSALFRREPDKPSRKKPMFPVNDLLRHYLKNHGREVHLPVSYRDLLQFTYSIPLKDKNGKDSLWETVVYDMREWQDRKSVV